MPDPVADAFASLLSAARKESGMSQETLAQLSGLDRTTISQAERGASSPRLSTLIQLAGALDMDPCDLVPKIRWSPPSDHPQPTGEFGPA